MTMEQAEKDRLDAVRVEQVRRERWVSANIERAQLREQAWIEHKSNLEAEERRYQAELAHIDTVYELRTGNSQGS
jgi:hypothetical protein